MYVGFGYTSGSMQGTAIDELNKGVANFIEEVQSDDVASYSVEIGIISVGGRVKMELPFTTAVEIDEVPKLTAGGATPLDKAVQLAIDSLDERKREYQSAGVAYYQPWVVIISDGVPTDNYVDVAAKTYQLSEQRKLVVLPLGVADASIDTLPKFSNRCAKKLDGLKFKEFFEWLSASMSRVSASASTSDQVQLPATDSWDSI